MVRIAWRTLFHALTWPFLGIAIASCGGGGGGGTSGARVPQPPGGGGSSGWVADSFLPAAGFAGKCVSPRSGLDPATGQPYADVQGASLDENNWLRSWSNDLYLWYDEVVDRDPGSYTTAQYFELLKTMDTTSSGNPKDRFHFTYSTAEWRALAQSGVTAGYGAEWAIVSSLPPRQIVVAYTQAGPASSANLQRGEAVIAVDGVDVVDSNTTAAIDAFVAGLYPDQPGEAHTFTLRNPQTALSRTVTMQAELVTVRPVENVKAVPTTSGYVGYIRFNDHLATAEGELVAAINALRRTPIVDLVLDLRYNGGGYLAIASELAYMIAGSTPTAGQTFESLRFSDKHTSINPVTGGALTPMPFFSTTLGFSTTAGQSLPTLDLPRVFVLTGATTCSASEAIINALRGVGVQVIQIGSATCGKPYGFYPQDNCGTTYFTIQFQGVNAAGFGDYTDGFIPTNAYASGGERLPGCSVGDDFSRALGDPLEGRFAAALAYRLLQSCPNPTGVGPLSQSKPSAARQNAPSDGIVIKSPWLQNRSLAVP